jgi:hypothetical protein
MIDRVVGKAYLGPPRTHADHNSWQSNVLKSESFFMNHTVDGGPKGVIIVFSMDHSIDIPFDTLYDYIYQKGTIHEKLVENTFDRRNPRIGIHAYFRKLFELKCVENMD